MLTVEQLNRAKRLNRIYAKTLNLGPRYGGMPGWASHYSSITAAMGFTTNKTPSEDEFAQLVANWQSSMNVRPVDGILGAKTWASLAPHLDRLPVKVCETPPTWLSNASSRDVQAEEAAIAVQMGSSTTIPGRGWMFVIVEMLPEVGAKHLIRKVAVVPKDFSLLPKNAMGTLRPAMHALGDNLDQSQFISSSGKSYGAATMKGTPLLIDAQKVIKAGGRIVETAEVIADLKALAVENPRTAARVEKLISTIRQFEGEVLIEGATPPKSAKPVSQAHKAYIDKAEEVFDAVKDGTKPRAEAAKQLQHLDDAFKSARNVGRVGRGVMVIGVAMTAYDVGTAIDESIEQKSFKPVAAETVRQVGGWGGGAAGAKIGFVAGAAVGIETGPGAIVTGAVGAIIFGAAGYFGADWVADFIHEN